PIWALTYSQPYPPRPPQAEPSPLSISGPEISPPRPPHAEPSPALGVLPTPLHRRSPASSIASIVGPLYYWLLLTDLRLARTLACVVISPPRSAAGHLRLLLATSRWLSARSTSAQAVQAGSLYPSYLPPCQIEGGRQEFFEGWRQPRDQQGEGPPLYKHIERNEFAYRKHRKQKDEDIAVCVCKFDADNPDSACGERCLNLLTSMECTLGYCPCGDNCKNQKFKKCEYPKLKLFKTEGRGWGLPADEDIMGVSQVPSSSGVGGDEHEDEDS
ncbi:hypothetical protein Taro_038745, partial [Colocasia esculenta]|nr:hypothetical protein [Colocasia esculenta]